MIQFVVDPLNAGVALASITTSPADIGNTWTVGAGSIVFDASNTGVYQLTPLNGEGSAYASGSFCQTATLTWTVDVKSDINYSGVGLFNAGQTHGYTIFTYNGSGWSLGKKVLGGSSTDLVRVGSGTPIATGNHTISLTATIGASSVTLAWSIDGVAQTGYVDSSSPYLDLEIVGLNSYVGATANTATTGSHISGITATQLPLNNAAVSAPGNSSTQIVAVATEALGGTTPITAHQWYTDGSAFASGNGTSIGGQTSLTLTVSSPPAQLAAYRCRYTDSNSNLVFSNVLLARQWPGLLVEGLIGDSIIGAYGVAGGSEWYNAAYIPIMQKAPRRKYISVNNRYVGGSLASQWAQGQSNYTTAVAALTAAGVNFVHVMLGTSDGKLANLTSPSTFQTGLTSLVSGLVGLGWQVMLHYPTIPQIGGLSGLFGAASVNSILSYLPIIDGLINGTTVLRGTTETPEYFYQQTAELQADQTHPNATGEISLGQMIAGARIASLLAPGDGPVPTPITVTLSGNATPGIPVYISANGNGTQPLTQLLVTNGNGTITPLLTPGSTVNIAVPGYGTKPLTV